MQKKLLSILLVLCMLLGMFPMAILASAEETENVETTTPADVVEISTADALVALMNNPDGWAGSYKLADDIDLSTYTGELAQAPIGNASVAFTGTFDGNNQTISGINLVAGSASGYGLFAVVSDDGDATVIKDLTIEGAVSSTSNFVGGLVGVVCGEAEISGITSNLTSINAGGTGRVGGIVGGIVCNGALGAISGVEKLGGYTVKITDCVNNANIAPTGASIDRVGGILGTLSSATGTRAATTVIIDGCVNNGNIKSTKGGAAGIAGNLEGGAVAGNVVTVTECVNNGVITAGTSRAGGILGTLDGMSADNTLTVEKCVNYGAVNAAQVPAGIVGYVFASYNVDSYTLITECDNYGDITASGSVSNGAISNAWAGGIVGYAKEPTDATAKPTAFGPLVISNCYNEGTVSVVNASATKAGNVQIGGIVGYSFGARNSLENRVIEIRSCWNAGDVTAKYGNDLGGVLGIANGVFLYDCLNTGNVTVTSAGGALGGIVGRTSSNGVIVRSYSNGTVATGSTGTKSAVVGKFDAVTSYTHGALYYTGDVADTYAVLVAAENVGIGSYFTGINEEGAWYLTDNGPELVCFHEHDNDAKFVPVEGGHVTACYCNDATTFGTDVLTHVMVDGTCEDCGYIACAHANTEEQVTLEATCTDYGYYNVYCNDCHTFVSQGNAIDIDPDAHTSNVNYIVNDCDNSGYVLYYHKCCNGIAYEDDISITEIYVSTAGRALTDVTGPIGDSEENAFLNFEEAMIYAAASATANGEATIIIVDKGIVSTSNYKTPAYDGLITITGGELHFNAATKRWFANGDVKFENLTFTNNTTGTASAGGMRMFAQNHYFEMGVGVVMGNDTDIAIDGYPSVNGVKMYVQGGFENGKHENNPNLVIRSGTYWYIGGWNQITNDAEATSLSHGTEGSITIGKLNEEDTLFTKYLVGYTTGKQQLSADSKVTIIIDGEVGIQTLIPGTQNDISANKTMLYETDIVLKNGANINAANSETIKALDITGATTCQNTKVTVYVDQRSEDAIADAAIFTADDLFSKMGTVYEEKTYAEYCATYFGHDDADEDTFCDECDASLACDHVNNTKVVVTVGTCTVPGTYNAICADCGQRVYGEDQTELTVNLDNHVSAEGASDATWVANENGTFDLVCNLCGNKVVEGADAAYVYIDPLFKHQMTTSDTALGISEDTAVRTLVEAVERLKTVGGKIIFTSALEITSKGINNLPAWEKEITFTYGATATGFRIVDHGAVVHFNGPTKIEKFVINGGNTTGKNNSDGGWYNIPVFVANWNDFTVGTDVQAFGASYFVIGNLATASTVANYENVDLGTIDENGETVQKTVKVTLNRTHAKAVSTDEATKQPATATFDRVYLGTRNRTTTPITVKNVHIDFESIGATFNLVYAGSVSEGDQAFMENCSIKAVFGGLDNAGEPCDAYIKHFQVGQGNTNGSGTAYLDKLDIEFNGTAYMQKSDENHKDTAIIKTKGFSTRNVKDVTIKISNGADRVYEYTSGTTTKTAEKYMEVPFYISASNGYVPTGTEKVTISYGSHSFAKGVAYPTFNKMYTYTTADGEAVAPVVNAFDECTWDEGKITTEATPDKDGVKTYTCSVCERTKKETVEYVCTAHVYVAAIDGTYYCANKCGTVDAPVADAVIAVTPTTAVNGVATVNVVINAAEIWGTRFSVKAPAGFTLTGVTSTLGEIAVGTNAFTFTGADDYALPYSMAVLNMATDENNNIVNGTLENAVVATLTFAVDATVEAGTYRVDVTVEEAYTVDEQAVETVVVAADVVCDGAIAPECEHTNTTTTSTATCTEAGVETVTCDDCGEKISETAVEALGHAWDNGVVTTEPKPGVEGVKTFTCGTCGETKTEAVEALAVAAYVDGVAYATVEEAVAAVNALGTVEIAEGVVATINPTNAKIFYLAGDLDGVTIGEGFVMDTTGRYKRENGALVADEAFPLDETVVNIVRPVFTEDMYFAIPHGTALALEEGVIMKYSLTLSNSKIKPYVMMYAIVDLYSAEGETVDVDPADTKNNVARRIIMTDVVLDPNNADKRVFEITGVPAKAFNNQMDITYVGVLADGTVQYRTFADRGIGYYLANNAYKSSNDAKLQVLMREIMNYGAFAQLYFKYNEGNLLNASLDDADRKNVVSDYDIELDPKTGTTVNVDPSLGEVQVFQNSTSFALNLEDMITPIAKVKLVAGMTEADYANATAVLSYVDVHGEPQTCEITPDKWTIDSEGRRCITITGVPAKDLRQQMSFTIYNNYGTASQSRIFRTFVRSLPETYANNNKTAGDYLAELTTAIIAYAQAAADYFTGR